MGTWIYTDLELSLHAVRIKSIYEPFVHHVRRMYFVTGSVWEVLVVTVTNLRECLRKRTWGEDKIEPVEVWLVRIRGRLRVGSERWRAAGTAQIRRQISCTRKMTDGRPTCSICSGWGTSVLPYIGYPSWPQCLLGPVLEDSDHRLRFEV